MQKPLRSSQWGGQKTSWAHVTLDGEFSMIAKGPSLGARRTLHGGGYLVNKLSKNAKRLGSTLTDPSQGTHSSYALTIKYGHHCEYFSLYFCLWWANLKLGVHDGMYMIHTSIMHARHVWLASLYMQGMYIVAVHGWLCLHAMSSWYMTLPWAQVKLQGCIDGLYSLSA